MSRQLTDMSRQELEQLKSDIDDALDQLSNKEREEALQAAEQAVAKYGFSLADVTGGKSGRKGKKGGAKSSSAPKYKNPQDPSQTWTGRGRQPSWFKDAVQSGTAPQDMEI